MRVPGRDIRRSWSKLIAIESFVFFAAFASGPGLRAEQGSLHDQYLAQARSAYAQRHQLGEAAKSVDLFGKAISVRATYSALWEGARAVTYLGQNMMSSATQREKRAVFAKGLAWAGQAVAANANGAEGHFFVAVLAGLHAKSASFFHQMAAAGDIRAAAERALKLNPGVECGGPYRLLGVYYRKLPAAFGGDNQRALKLLERAVQRCPGEPTGRYYFGETLNHLGQAARARQELQWLVTHPPADAASAGAHRRFQRKAKALLAEIPE